MPLPLFLLFVSLELLVAISILAPSVLPGRFQNRPQLGIGVWLMSFATALLAALIALLAAVWIAASEYAELTETALAETNLLQVLAVSFAPWVLLAMAGVFLALANRRLQTPTPDPSSLIAHLAVTSRHFSWQRTTVLVLPVQARIASTIGGKILISEAVDKLPAQLREAVLWHELAHIRLGHSALRTLTRFASRLMPRVVAATAMRFELDRLCELAADSWAARQCGEATLLAARKEFQEFLPTSVR